MYRICLIGSGGVGTIASLVLCKSGRAHVTVVLRSTYDYVSKHGWQIDSIDHGKIDSWRPDRIVSSLDEAAADGVEYDFVVVCTKQLPERNPLAAMIAPVVTPKKTTVVMIQNGLGIETDVVARWPNNAVVSSVSHIGSAVHAPNRVVQIGTDNSKIGAHFHSANGGISDDESREKAALFVDLYRAGGAKVELVDDILTARWEKLLWNSTFNTVCALTRADVGQLQRSRGRESLLVPMMREVWNTASAAGHPLPESILHWMAYRLPDDLAYRPSMLLDLEQGRPMEIEVILGNPIRVAKEIGVPTPTLETVYNLLKVEQWKIEETEREKKEAKEKDTNKATNDEKS